MASKKIKHCWFFAGLSLLLFTACEIEKFRALAAQPIPSIPTQLVPTNSATNPQVLVPDWSQISFGTLPFIQKSGQLTMPDGTIRSWTSGQTPDEFLSLSDIYSLRPDLTNLDAIASTLKKDGEIDSIALEAFPLAGEQTLSQLAKIVPNLGQFPVNQIPPVEAVLSVAEGGSNWMRSKTLQEILSEKPALGNLKLSQLDLSRYAISDIPNLNATQLGQFEGWQDAKINEIPYLNALPLGSFPVPLAQQAGAVSEAVPQAIARIDMVWSKAEKKRERTISGSDVVGFEYPCQGDECANIELDDLENAGRQQQSKFEGVSWIAGSQKVEGGSGCLKFVNGGKEPTGRLPFGDTFKMVVEATHEDTDTADFALYFRMCSPCGCTPYFIGPVPLLSYRINAPIFVGSLDAQPTTNAVPPASSSGSIFPDGNTSKVPFTDSQNRAPIHNTVPSQNQPNPLETIKGVNLDSLQQAIASFQGNSSDKAIGSLVQDRGRTSRALGKYQMMSSDPLVADNIAAKSGGKEWLLAIANGKKPTTEELWRFFPPADQEKVFRQLLIGFIQETAEEIDPATRNLFRGDRLIERVCQKYFGGDSSAIDSDAVDLFGQQTLKEYGQKILAQYKSLKG